MRPKDPKELDEGCLRPGRTNLRSKMAERPDGDWGGQTEGWTEKRKKVALYLQEFVFFGAAAQKLQVFLGASRQQYSLGPHAWLIRASIHKTYNEFVYRTKKLTAATNVPFCYIQEGENGKCW